jgi:hypothetical protein
VGARSATRSSGGVVAIIVDKDLRKDFGPARDQDPRPTCMAFAGSDAHAAVRAGWQPLSVEWAYYHALKRDGGVPHQGATMWGMLEALRADGQPEESVWPYIPEMFSDLSTWFPPNAKKVFRRDSQRNIPSSERLIACLDANQPVLFTMSISKGFFIPETLGIVRMTEPLEPKRVHALVAVGHGHDEQDTFVLARNSWGAAWGWEGYCWIALSYLRPRLLRAATMTGEL